MASSGVMVLFMGARMAQIFEGVEWAFRRSGPDAGFRLSRVVP
jgi:hypothetical protein